MQGALTGQATDESSLVELARDIASAHAEKLLEVNLDETQVGNKLNMPEYLCCP